MSEKKPTAILVPYGSVSLLMSVKTRADIYRGIERTETVISTAVFRQWIR